MQIGNYQVYSIETGRFRLDGGSMFGSVPKVLWQKACEADEFNRIELAARSLLLVSREKRILVDTGLGGKYGSKELQLYGYDTSRSDLISQLGQRGLRPNDITDVILTHLHFDHAGGATVLNGDVSVPTFPNAKHYVQRAHWEHALSPNEKDRPSYKTGDFLPLAAAGLIEFVDGEADLFENLSFRLAYGHTPSLQLPVISDGKTTLFCCGDLVPTAAHVKPNYVMAYDLLPVTTIEEKRAFLGRAASEGWILFLEHDPTVTCGIVRPDGNGFAWAARSVELSRCDSQDCGPVAST